MATIVLQVPDESLVSKIKSACKMLVGVTSVKVTRSSAESSLYDPETGKYLNKKTMKVIEDARKGKDVIEVGSMDDYLKLVSKQRHIPVSYPSGTSTPSGPTA